MYLSKYEVERKFQQLNFSLNELLKFENKLFVHNGIDIKTNSYPFEVRLITYIILARSIFQYALKELSFKKEKQKYYDEFMHTHGIVSLFKELRDSEIHSLSLTHRVIATFKSEIHFNDNPARKENDTGKITYSIGIRLEPTNDLINSLKNDGLNDLADQALNGEPVFRQIEFNGNTNIFCLVRDYHAAIELFIEYGKMHGFIT